jgi:photosystem II stability/assembly factor-like uncharacterized protein
MKIGGGDLPIARVDPKNADIVYSASIVAVKSSDGGKTWTSWRGAPGGDDYQNLWINPENSQIILLVADQGALVTVNGGQTWSTWYNQPTAQFYHAITTNTFPYKVCAGQQESGSVCINSRGNDGEITFRDWHPVGAIEYGYIAPDPLDPDIVYGAGRTEVSRFHWSTGQVENLTPIPFRGNHRVDRTEPIMFSPVNPHLLYYASNVLFETSDGGHTWQTVSPDLTRKDPGAPASVTGQEQLNPKASAQRGAIYTLAPSFENTNTIWAGTDDGLVWITRDGGKNWSNITPPTLTPWSKVTQISASHFDDNTAYVSVSRFRIDDLRPYLYRTHDGGTTWQVITSGLAASSPLNTVREDPVRKGLLFAGSETEVSVSFDDGDHWQSLQLNLPHTSMRDLWIHETDLIVATHGRSFWILDDISTLRELSPEMTSEAHIREPHLFTPAVAYRVRRDTNTDTPLPVDEPAGENPPDGAILDYYLPAESAAPARIQISDSQGNVIREYSTDDKPAQTEEQLQKELIPRYWLRPHRSLPNGKGMHRWVWDLRYPAPASSTHEYPSAAVPHDTPRYPLGPLVLPGTYRICLKVEGHSYEAPLVVKLDPRVKVSAAALQEQFDLEMRLVVAVSEGSEALLQARSIREQLANAEKSGKAAPKQRTEELDKKILELLDGPKESSDATQQRTLSSSNSDLITLYKDVEKADSQPTMAQQKAFSELSRDVTKLLRRWNELKSKEIPALNGELKASGLPGLQLDVPPQGDYSGQNEE